jgi:hypothetical protein
MGTLQTIRHAPMLTPVVLSPRTRLALQHLSEIVGSFKDRTVKTEGLFLNYDGCRALCRVESDLT